MDLWRKFISCGYNLCFVRPRFVQSQWLANTQIPSGSNIISREQCEKVVIISVGMLMGSSKEQTPRQTDNTITRMRGRVPQ